MADIPPSTFNRDESWGRNRVEPRRYGVGRYGVGRYSPSDPTRFAWTRIKPVVLAFLFILGAGTWLIAADTFTPNLLLINPDIDVEDPLETWGSKMNRNRTTLDVSICDKRVGCTYAGPVIFASTTTLNFVSISTMTVSSITITNSFFLLGGEFQGFLTNVEIKALQCAGGFARCFLVSLDEADQYISTGSLTGQYRNARTGKSP